MATGHGEPLRVSQYPVVVPHSENVGGWSSMSRLTSMTGRCRVSARCRNLQLTSNPAKANAAPAMGRRAGML